MLVRREELEEVLGCSSAFFPVMVYFPQVCSFCENTVYTPVLDGPTCVGIFPASSSLSFMSNPNIFMAVTNHLLYLMTGNFLLESQ